MTHSVAGASGATAAAVFAVLWSELVTVLGTAAAASLVRRAVKRGCARHPELEGLQVTREGWEYRYVLPPAWQAQRVVDSPALADLVRTELVPLLRELTGQIVLRRLGRVPGLEQLGFPVAEEK